MGYPIRGQSYTPKVVTTPFGGGQSRAAGFSGTLPATHQGIDLAYPAGTSVVAAVSGTIIRSGWDNSGFGNLVQIQGDDGRTYLYGHLSALNDFQPGNRVTAGTSIGDVGSTGNASGPHLHFEVREGGKAIDPTPFLSGESGDMTMAENQPSNPQIATLQNQAREASRQVETWQANLAHAQSYLDELVQSDPKGIKSPEAITAAEKRVQEYGARLKDWQGVLNTSEDQLAKAQVAAAKTDAPDAPRTFQGTDGRQYVLSADGKNATLVTGQPDPKAAKTFQVVEDPSTGAKWTYDPATGQPVAQLFPGKPEDPSTVQKRAVDLATAQVTLQRVQAQLAQEQDPLQRQKLQLEVDTARANLSKLSQPQQVQTDTTQPNLAFRNPLSGAISTQANPNFDQQKAAMAQKLGEIDLQYKQGLLDAQQRDQQWAQWKAQYIDLPNQAYQQQRQQWSDEQSYAKDQAAEQIRVQQENQARQKYADTQGQQAVADWRQMAPAARSTEFTNEYAAAAANLGHGVHFTPGAITAPVPVPNMADVSRQRVAQVLSDISPAAAVAIGKPPPQYGGMDLQAMLAAMPRYGGPAAPVAP